MEIKNKGSKFLRISVILFFSLIMLAGLSIIVANKFIENELVHILNENPDRTYDITYESFDLNYRLNGFKLKNASILPLVPNDSSAINCTLEEIKVTDLNWRAFLVHKKLSISEMIFKKPDFVIIKGLKKKKADDGEVSSTGIQKLFGDILSRANLNDFKIIDGSFTLIEKEAVETEIIRIGNINLEAKGIQTDSVQWKHPIPFKLEEINTSLEDIMFKVDEYSSFKCQSISYDAEKSSITLLSLSLKYNDHWVGISKRMGEAKDMVEVDLKSLTISGLEAKSQLYGKLDIRSKLLVIDGLNLNDHKNKNLPIKKYAEQALFSGMVAAIPFDLRVDTIQLKDINISYSQLSKGKDEPGTFHFNKLSGSIYNFTTIQEYQDLYKKFELNMYGQISNSGKLTVNISVPYAKDEFDMKGRIENLDITALNPTLEPIAGLKAESGQIHLMEIKMHANTKSSYNQMIINYDDLKIHVLKEEGEEVKKSGLLSFAANSLIRTRNLPEDDNYLMAKYHTKRNAYRAPFHLMFLALQDGLVQILPTKVAKELMKQQKKKKKKKSKN